MLVSVSGSRYINDYNKIAKILDKYNITEVNVGDCRGLDEIVVRYCRLNDIKCNIFKADWNKYGKSAGPIRNKELIKGTELLLAFPMSDSVGTYNSISVAEKDNIKVETYLIW